jgi:HAE1 family hydrophobic/amphiphilic exporter-1
MSIPAISIKRPVMATIISLLFIFVGLVSFFRIPVQQSPNITYPTIIVNTILPGGNADIVNQTITKPIEKELNTVTDIQTITSASEQGKSTITLSFNLGTNMTDAYNAVQNVLGQVSAILPKEAKPPVIALSNSSDAPILLLSLTGPQGLEQLNQIARTQIQPALQNVKGVGETVVSGASEEAVSINIDLTKMAALKITMGDVERAFNAQHVQIPGGTLANGRKSYNLNLDLEYHKVDELNRLIITTRQNKPIFLKDISTVKFGFANKDGSSFFNNSPSIGLSIIKQHDANTVSTITRVNERLQNVVIPNLPNGVKLETVYSQSSYILDIIHELEQDIWLSVLTAGFVILLFLRNLRPTLIVICVVPVALLGAIATIFFSGYTLNSITLLALVILVGVVVDDSIIVLENIYRHKNLDTEHPLKASIDGANEVMFPLIACSLSLVCIFLPIVFMGGPMAMLFKSFAVVVTAGVIISLITSITFTPVLCARYLKSEEKNTKFVRVLEHAYGYITKAYAPCLQFALRFPWINILVIVAMVVLSVPALKYVNKTFMPAEVNTGYFNVQIQTPEGMASEYTRQRVLSAENLIKKLPNVSSTFSTTGPTNNEGSISVQLVDKKHLTMSQSQIMNNLQNMLNLIPGAQYFIQFPEQLTYEVKGPDFNQLINVSYSLISQIQQHPELGQSYIFLAPNQPQLQVYVDRVLASSLGITPYDIASTLSFLGSGGVQIAKFSGGATSERYDVLMRTDNSKESSDKSMANLYLLGANNQYIPVSAIASFEKSLMPSRITRSALQYSIGFSSMPTISTNKAITEIQKIAATVLPKGYTFGLTGDTASLGDTEKDLAVTLALILIFMYMVLASQFNSFVQPIIVIIAQPLALIGGVLILLITNQTLNVYSMIGMLLLVGLVTKNSILLISMANDLLEQGKSVRDALLIASPDRMRPVLMTSIAIILAMLPPAFATGSTYRTLALVIIGGMVVSTILSLIIVPSIYLLLGKFNKPKTAAEINELQEIENA